jgi:hypothetical protein
MAIDITEFSNASISISPTGVGSGNFGILGFLTNEQGVVGVAERARAYTSLASVGGDWAASTQLYKAATAFYAQTPTPTDFVAIMSFGTAQEAALTGGGSDTVAEIIAAGDLGEMTVTIDGTLVTLPAVDLSGASPASFDGIATELETLLDAQMTGVTVEWSGYSFEVFGVTTGSAGTITPFYGDNAEVLGLAQHQAKTSNGVDVETAVDSLAAAETLGIDYTGLDVHKQWRDSGLDAAVDSGNNAESISTWAEAASKIFCNVTNNLATLSSVIDSDVGSVLKNRSGIRFTHTSFSKNAAQYGGSSLFGRAASVNFASVDSTITLNLKQMPTIDAEDLTPGEFGVLRSKNVSAVMQIGSSINAFSDSRMAGGSWLDTTHGLLWLENRCEVDMFNLLYVNNTKIPFTQVGINTAVQRLESSLEAGVRNGLLAPGYLPDGTFLPKGYRVTAVTLEDTPVSDKSNRIYNGLSFEAVGAGALHEVTITGEYSE